MICAKSGWLRSVRFVCHVVQRLTSFQTCTYDDGLSKSLTFGICALMERIFVTSFDLFPLMMPLQRDYQRFMAEKQRLQRGTAPEPPQPSSQSRVNFHPDDHSQSEHLRYRARDVRDAGDAAYGAARHSDDHRHAFSDMAHARVVTCLGRALSLRPGPCPTATGWAAASHCTHHSHVTVTDRPVPITRAMTTTDALARSQTGLRACRQGEQGIACVKCLLSPHARSYDDEPRRYRDELDDDAGVLGLTELEKLLSRSDSSHVRAASHCCNRRRSRRLYDDEPPRR